MPRLLQERFEVGRIYHSRILIDASMVERFANFSGDRNPIHMNADEAKAYGYPRQVAHGAILMSLVSKAIGMEIPGPGAMWMSQEVEWLQPVYVGDEIELQVKIENVSSAAKVLTLETTAVNLKGVTIMKGRSKVKVLEKFQIPAGEQKTKELVALVTGSSRGIGKAIAEALAKNGIRVAINYRESRQAAENLALEIQSQGGIAESFQADLCEPAAARMLAEKAMDKFGRLDIVIHSASPLVQKRSITDLNYEAFEPFLKTYLGSALSLVATAEPGMKKRGFGRFIFLGTSFILGTPPTGIAPYIAAKEALWGLVKSLAVELGPSGITSNMISPSMMITDFTADIPSRIKEVEAQKNPLRRLASVEDAAAVAAFLASKHAGYINGVNLPVTGGQL